MKNFTQFLLEEKEEIIFPTCLNKCLKVIKNDILNLSINKNFSEPLFYDFTDIEDFPIRLKINFIVPNGKEKKGDANLLDIYNSKTWDNCKINVYLNNTRQGKILETITHELTHIYQLYNLKDLFTKSSFFKDLKFKKLKHQDVMPLFRYFRDLVYYSFEHEVDAFIKQVYYLLSYMNRDNDKNKLIEYVKILKYYHPSKALEKFNYQQFIKDFNSIKDGPTFLKYLTNEFNMTYDGQPVSDIYQYYKNWESHFHKTSKEYKVKIDQVIKDVMKNYKNIEENYLHEDYNIDGIYPEMINIDDLIFLKIKDFLYSQMDSNH